MQNIENDKRIEVELLNGNKKAFEIFYRKNFADLWRFATHYVMSRDIARDIVQDTFVMLLENRKNINPSQNLKGYLYTTIKNRALNHLRSYKIADSNQCRLIEAILFTATEEEEDLMEKVNHYRHQLSQQQQAIITLKIEGKNYEEIAEKLNITTSTVNVHIKRAYKFLRDNILLIIIIKLLLEK